MSITVAYVLITTKVPTVEESRSEFLKETAANFSSKEGGFTGMFKSCNKLT